MHPRLRATFCVAALGASLVGGCSKHRPALGASSQAPEYSGQWANEPVADAPTPVEARSAAAPPAPCPPIAATPPVALPEALNDGLYRLAGAGLELFVDPAQEGRAVRLALDGRDLLLPKTGPHAGGSFSAEIVGDLLLLQGAVGADGVRTERSYRLDVAARTFVLVEALVNTSPEPRRAELRPAPALRFEGGFDVVVREPAGVRAHVRDSVLCVESTEPAAPLTELAPGAAVSQTTRLHLRRLPPSLTARPGNPELVGFVKAVL